jgi:hypothetical protein
VKNRLFNVLIRVVLRRGTFVGKAGAQCTFSLALPEDVSRLTEVTLSSPTRGGERTDPGLRFGVGGAGVAVLPSLPSTQSN